MKLLNVSVLALLFLPLQVFADHGILSVVKNKVWIVKKDQQQEDARRGTKIEVGDKLITDKEAYVKILMSDKNILHVGPETQMVLEAYETAGNEGTSSVINVLYGRVRSALENKYDGKSRRFQIHTTAAVLGVRGTDFVTQHLLDNQTTKMVVFDSKVQAQGLSEAGELLGDVEVSAGELTVIEKGAPPTPPEKLPLEKLKEYEAQSLTSDVMSIAGLVGAAGAIAAVAVPPVPPLPSLPSIPLGGGDDEEEEKTQEASAEKIEQPATEEEKKPENVVEQKTDVAPPPAEPEDDDGGLAIALKAGTLGGSLSLSYPIVSGIRLKLDAYNTFNFEFSGGNQDFYTNTVDFSGYGLLIELGSNDAWQLIAGAYLTNNRLEVTGTPVGTENIGGTDYTFSDGDSVSGDGEFKNSIAPYIGLGWKMGFFGLFDFVGDFGALYVGELQVNNLNYTGAANVSDADESAEADEIVEEINKYKVFPVVRLGISKTF